MNETQTELDKRQSIQTSSWDEPDLENAQNTKANNFFSKWTVENTCTFFITDSNFPLSDSDAYITTKQKLKFPSRKTDARTIRRHCTAHRF